ncbi:FadR/GntR family transcriptional regulator [Gordonia humi]|uniref:DNA-binding FadR family transcriptional regulator n=1 Tax=Gordonia humi TaxID=686429 RepID=A0A840EUT4_9ACTN|nr:FCD domain-containing protein [Gordonia humi]MBB4135341.1 DNA-binding FadR family transcriptional regulator [Gordonia humi]
MPRIAQNRTLPEQVADQLRDRIAAGEFPVGSLLPGELALAAEMGVSRGSVREALRSLVLAGMLGARPGYGTFVTATSDVAPALARRVDRDRTADVEQVRSILEREGARLAARNASADHLRGLREALAARAEAVDGAAYAAADIAFHRILLDASGNALLAELYRGVGGNEQALEHLNSRDFPITSAPEVVEIDRAHQAIFDAVAARDPEAAAAAVDRTVVMVHAWAEDNR